MCPRASQEENELHLDALHPARRLSSCFKCVSLHFDWKVQINVNISIFRMYINPDYYYVEQLPTMKKSGQLRALAGSRNCFFSPVNCIITHDINSYRRLAKGSSYAWNHLDSCTFLVFRDFFLVFLLIRQSHQKPSFSSSSHSKSVQRQLFLKFYKLFVSSSHSFPLVCRIANSMLMTINDTPCLSKNKFKKFQESEITGISDASDVGASSV